MNQIAQYPPLIIRLRGSQKQMGEQHGEILRQIGGWEAVLDFYPRMVETLLMQGFPHEQRKPWLKVAARPLLELALERMEAHRPTAYRERTKAFLRAAGVSASNSKYLQVMDVFQNVIGLISNIGLVGTSQKLMRAAYPACSSIAVWSEASADGQLLHARNFDFPGLGIWDEAPTVVFCEPDEGYAYGFVTTRGGDLPGISCFNSEGLTLTFHTRLHREVTFSAMSAIDLGHEIIRRAGTLDEAIAVANEFRIASTWGIIVSSAREKSAVVIETSGKNIDVTWPEPTDDFLTNTNHYKAARLRSGELSPSATWRVHSVAREKRLRQHAEAGAREGGLTSPQLETILGDNCDADAVDETRSMGSVLAQLISVMSMVNKPEANELRLSIGTAPTGWGPYASIPYEWGREVGFRELEIDTDSLQGEQPDRHYIGGERARGYQHYQSAYRIDMEGGSVDDMLAEMEQAVALDPTDPSYRLLAAGFNMKKGFFEKALLHLQAGLHHEQGDYRRGQLLFWASRLASVLQRNEDARRFRNELGEIDDEHLGQKKQEAQKDARLGISERKLYAVVPNFMLVDLTS